MFKPRFGVKAPQVGSFLGYKLCLKETAESESESKAGMLQAQNPQLPGAHRVFTNWLHPASHRGILKELLRLYRGGGVFWRC